MRESVRPVRAGDERWRPSLRQGWLFVAVVYALTWLAALPAILDAQGALSLGPAPAKVLEYAQLAMPTVVALGLVVLSRGVGGLKWLLGQALRWRFGAGYYAYALFLLPLVMLLGVALYRLLGGEVDEPLVRAPSLTIWVGLVRVSLGEEFGWRGYALPAFLARFGTVGASLVVGLAWACWHAPFFLMPGSSVYGASLPLFVAQMIVFSIMYTWLYLRTGSLLSVILFHISQDLAFYAIPAPAGAWVTTGLFLLVAVAFTLATMPRPFFGTTSSREATPGTWSAG